MKRRWGLARRGFRAARQVRTQLVRGPRVKRLIIETLEDRRLLASLTDLSIDATQHRASSLIVQFKDGASSPGSLSAYLSTANVGSEWALTPGLRHVDLNPSADLTAALSAYNQDPNVEYAEPDYRVSLQLEPDDPDFGNTWGLNNTGQTGGVDDADIDAPEAWDVTTGKTSTIVAVIDTGVDYNHPDLYENIWINQGEIPATRLANLTDIDGDGRITFVDLNDPQNQGPFKITDVNGDGRIDGADLLAPMKKTGGQDNGNGGWADGADTDHNGYTDDFDGYDFVNHDDDPMDDHFHGTHVSGTIGAMGNDGNGIAGVNWHVQIMALKFLDGSGGGYESDAISALNYAVANGAVVSNNSWGGGGFSPAFLTAIQNAASKGHIFVAAAGNDGWNNDLDPFYPAGYDVDNVISVAATDDHDQLAWFSNYGTKSVDLAAPGVSIYSTFPTHMTPAMQDDGFTPNYGTISGTSMATPHVTGVVALVRSLHPEWTYTQVIDQIEGSVDVIDGASLTITGGRVNAAAAVGNTPPDTVGPRVISTDPSGIVTGPIDHVRLKFNESLDLSTITVDDVRSLTGPDGPIPVLAIVPVAGSSRQFDVTFAAQSTLGDYSLVLGPDISDVSGNLLDQDRDGTGGEDPDDLITTLFSIADVANFPSTDVPAPITDFVTTTSFLAVGRDITISDLNIQLNISYPLVGNLAITLESPSGTDVALIAYDLGPDADFADTIFDDAATTPIAFGFPPYSGSYRPDERLSAFNGENASGTWKLMIDDLPFWGFGDGYLNSWSLQIKGDGSAPPPPPPPPPPGNRPPVAGDDSLQGEVNTRLSVDAAQLLANDSDPDGDALSITFVGNPAHGSVSLDQNQMITFTPDRDFQGQASFQYIVTDGSLTATGNVSVDVQPPSFQWHNSQLGADVDHNGIVTAFDAMIIISKLNADGTTPLAFLFEGSALPNLYLDVAADDFLTAKDALDVIDYLNANGSSPSSMSVQSDVHGASTDQALMSFLGAPRDKDGRLL